MTTEMVNSEEPALVKKRAIDVLPYVNAIWCTVAGSKPFANTIESRSWSEDGSKIWFMLGTHNFYDAAPDAEIEVVEVKCSAAAESLARWHEEDARKMAERPEVQPPGIGREQFTGQDARALLGCGKRGRVDRNDMGGQNQKRIG
jgi:hypothetical protein